MKQIQVRLMLFCSFLVVGGGCATNRTSLTDTGHVTIENRYYGKVKILWSSAYEKEGDFIVNGVLKKRDYTADSVPAHVHVLVLSCENNIIQSMNTSNLYVPRNRVGHGNNWKRFEVSSTSVPEKDSRILVIVHTHTDSHTDKDLLSSESKMAEYSEDISM